MLKNSVNQEVDFATNKVDKWTKFQEVETQRKLAGEYETVGEFDPTYFKKLKNLEKSEDLDFGVEVFETLDVDEVEKSEDTSVLNTLEIDPIDLEILVQLSYKFEPSDMGNAERFKVLFGRNFKFVAARKSWFFYNGRKWEKCDNGEAETAMVATIGAIKEEILAATALSRGTLEDSPQNKFLKALRAHYRSSNTARNIKSALATAAMLQEFKLSFTELNAKSTSHMFNVENGTIDLRTGILRNFERSDHITLSTGNNVAETADCPIFKNFLNGVFLGSENLSNYAIRIFAAAMIGERKKSQEFYLLSGLAGSNGKSTLMNVMRKAFGQYSIVSSPNTWMASRNDDSSTAASPDLAELAGVRLVLVSELPKGRQFNESRIKSWTGGDTIKCRFLNENPIEITPEGTLVLSSNHRPKIESGDNSMWRRNKPLPFDANFSSENRDDDLEEKLMKELPEITRLLVDACLVYQKEGMGVVPDEVLKCQEGYKAHYDTIGQFIKDVCTTSDKGYTPTNEIYNAYKQWAMEQGHTKSMIRKNFVDNLTRLGFPEGEKSKFQNRSVIPNLLISLY